MTRTAIALALCALALAACSRPAEAPAPSPTPSPTTSSPSPTPPKAPPTTAAPVTNPLNGLPTPVNTVSTRPALLVKVDNVGGALPQTGLPLADLIVEQPMEGGLTRLMAIFQSQVPGVVGPIRSARPVDAQVARLLGPTIMLFSGASPYEIAPVKADSRALLIADDWDTAPGTFERNPNKSGEHILYGDTAKAWEFGAKNGAKAGPPHIPFAFVPEPPRAGTPVDEVSMDFGDTKVRWVWDAKSARWLRFQNGREHEDTRTGQLGADSVLVISVPVAYDPRIKDVLGTLTPLPNTVGAGTGWLFRDGTMTKITWKRPTIDSPWAIADTKGALVGPKPGQTWVELLPDTITPSTE